MARAVPRARRRAELSHTHHRLVASLEPAEQEQFLQRAVAEQLTAAELRASIVAASPRTPSPDVRLDAEHQSRPALTVAPTIARLTVVLHLPPDGISSLRAAAQARGWTIDRLVEEAVAAYLADLPRRTVGSALAAGLEPGRIAGADADARACRIVGS